MNKPDESKNVDRRDIVSHLKAAKDEPPSDPSQPVAREHNSRMRLGLGPGTELLTQPVLEEIIGNATGNFANKGSGDQAPRPVKTRAILVVHGMGQQRPFDTINTVATGLYARLKAVELQGGPARPEQIDIGHARIGAELLPRASLKLEDTEGNDQHVDIFEAYWAPLTEGAVKLRDVFALLVRAGIYGIANCQQTFVRYIFGNKCSLHIPFFSLVCLLLTLASIVSLAVLNTALILIPVRQSLFKQSAPWLTDILRQDAVTVFNATSALLMIFALIMLTSLFWSRLQRHMLDKTKYKISGVLLFASIVSFAVVIAALIAAAATLPILVYAHRRMPGDISMVSPMVTALAHLFPMSDVVIAATLAGLLWIEVQLSRRNFVPLWTIASLLALCGGIAAMVWWSLEFGEAPIGGIGHIRDKVDAIPIGVLLVVAAAVARSFLIQYVGDVVAYVQSQTLDRFAELRTKIKATVCKTASAIYTHQVNGRFAYDDVIIVGHSLGSVIAYDTLNKLLLDDATGCAVPTSLKVKERTRLFLTFGSPLDKTAFIFASQAENPEYGVSGLLAASKQPLISTEGVRASIRWVNVYSHWDIVSGHLDFYDVPGDRSIKFVRNQRDKDALVWLGAHTEYWRNKKIYEVLSRHLMKPATVTLQ